MSDNFKFKEILKWGKAIEWNAEGKSAEGLLEGGTAEVVAGKVQLTARLLAHCT